MEKEINDIFEFLLLQSGRLIIYTSNDRQPIVLDNVPFIDRKERAVMRMLGSLQVQVRGGDGKKCLELILLAGENDRSPR